MNRKYESLCFVISPIGKEKSRIRTHSDNALNHIIKPALQEIGFNAIRADEIAEPGIITQQILEYLIHSAICVADLTNLNPNVMYELGIRHITGKPIIQIADKKEKLPFDLAGMRTIFFDLRNPNSVSSARDQVLVQLKDCLHHPQGFKPIFMESLINGALDDEKTRNLIRLHQASSSFKIYRVIDSILSQMEKDPKCFNRELFFESIEKALLESRRLCVGFRSRRLGDLYRWFEANYTRDELKEAVQTGQEKILERTDIDSNLKRIQLLEYLENIQVRVATKIEKVFQESD